MIYGQSTAENFKQCYHKGKAATALYCKHNYMCGYESFINVFMENIHLQNIDINRFYYNTEFDKCY